MSTVGFVAGGALLVGGVIVLLTGSSGSGKSGGRASSLFVAPDAYPGGAGLRVTAAF